MSLQAHVVNHSLKRLIRVLCRVEDLSLRRVPARGPLILAINHINFLEAPLIYTHMLPRPLVAVAKEETWHNPFLGYLADLWQTIPIRRGEADLSAMRQMQATLTEEKILILAPEGTRSGDGRLQRGYPGVVLIAARSGAPILPLVHYGGERFWDNLKHFRRTDFHIRIGRPFRLKVSGRSLDRDQCRQAIDEIMYQMAALLPPEYRGVYVDLERSTTDLIEFV